MVRILAILLLAASGLVRSGGSAAAAHAEECTHVACVAPQADTGCCGEPAPGSSYCPMSEGPCRCGISPAPAPKPLPDAPLPRTERDSVTGLPNGPPTITPVIEPDDTTPSMASLVVGLRAGKTHNEVQALLGVWQT